MKTELQDESCAQGLVGAPPGAVVMVTASKVPGEPWSTILKAKARQG